MLSTFVSGLNVHDSVLYGNTLLSLPQTDVFNEDFFYMLNGVLQTNISLKTQGKLSTNYCCYYYNNWIVVVNYLIEFNETSLRHYIVRHSCT